MEFFHRGEINITPKLFEPVKKVISASRKERLRNFIHGFQNTGKVDTIKLCAEIRGKSNVY